MISAPSRPVDDEAPPSPELVADAVAVAQHSTCRSQRGVVIFRGRSLVVSEGFNHQPRGYVCDQSAACKAVCSKTAVHAEAAAIRAGGDAVASSSMLHVKVVAGVLVPSGPPSCWQCSREILDARIATMWLYHDTGWRGYAAEEFHRLTLVHHGLYLPPKGSDR